MALPGFVLTAPVDTQTSDVVVPSFRRYLAIWIAGVIVLVGLIGAFDALIDPYLIIGMPRIAGLNAVKPETATHTQLAKDYLIRRFKPAGLLLGSSKADLGIDPASRFWPADARPAFNYGVPGTSIRDNVANLRRAIAIGTVRRVLVVLDIENFMKVPPKGAAATPAGGPGVRRVRDIALATLSLDALHASIATVMAQYQPHPVNLSPDGLTNDNGFRNDVKADGYMALFEQKDAENGAHLARLAASVHEQSDAGIAGLNSVAEIIALCRSHGIALDFALPPLHADLLAQFDRAGLWPRYQWAETLLTQLIAVKGQGAVRLWDFSGFDATSTEPIPSRAEHGVGMRWFWEPDHFKRVVGDRMLAAIYDGVPGYGVTLTPETLAAHLAAQTAARDAWLAGNAGDWRERLARAAAR